MMFSAATLLGFIYGAIAALAVWGLHKRQTGPWLAWSVIVASGMMFRAVGP